MIDSEFNKSDFGLLVSDLMSKDPKLTRGQAITKLARKYPALLDAAICRANGIVGEPCDQVNEQRKSSRIYYDMLETEHDKVEKQNPGLTQKELYAIAEKNLSASGY